MKKYTVAVLVNNQYGVLNRVTSMFRRRQFNITALTVSETESPDFSRITVVFDGEERSKELLIGQLYKLPDVKSIKELHRNETVSCELMLIKMSNNPETRNEIKAAADAFGAKAVDYTRESVVYRLTGDSTKIDEFIELMNDFEILEICRTGKIALEKGKTTIRNITNL